MPFMHKRRVVQTGVQWHRGLTPALKCGVGLELGVSQPCATSRGKQVRFGWKCKMTPGGLEPAIPGSVGRCLIHWATGPDVNYTHCAPLAQSFDGGTEVSVARLAAHQQRSDTTRRMLQPGSPRRHSLRKVAKHSSHQPAQKIERSLAQI